MVAAVPLSGPAFDASGLNALRRQAKGDPKQAALAAARQFEALFMQEIMKSMRSATLASGLMDGDSSKMATEMLDTQFAASAAGRPGGLAQLIARQLERQMSLSAEPTPELPAHPLVSSAREPRIPDKAAASFIARHGAAARQAEAATGIPATFMLAQAAHESGWGAREIRNADGTPSNNLFGIKAGALWKGPVAEVTTTEFVDGQAVKVKQKFRAYADASESFADYARLMTSHSRYRNVLAAGQDASRFAQGLQAAGYATDPDYSAKLTRVINTTLRLQRMQA